MVRYTLILLLILCSGIVALAAPHRTYSTIDVAGAVETDANGINLSNVIVGSYFDANGLSHGWIRKGNGIEVFDVPGSAGTFAHGINDSDQIVGWYIDSSSVQHGFFLESGTYATLDFPGAMLTNAWAINNSGVIVGAYEDTSGVFHGFEDANGLFTTIDNPKAVHTEVHGIRTDGHIVGFYVDNSGIQWGFLSSGRKKKGQLTFFSVGSNVSGSVATIDGIKEGSTETGVVVDSAPSQSGPFECFAGGGGGNGNLNFPGAVDTRCRGISGRANVGSTVVGRYTDTNGVIHGFFSE